MNGPAASRGSRPAIIAILATAICLAWRCFTLGMADALVASDPIAAAAWRPADPDAQFAIAQADFLAHRDGAAAARARLALVANPLDGRGYRIAAALADRAGERDRAEQLFELAQQRAPRDLPTRVKLAAYALRSGEHERAIHQIDELLRLQMELYPLVLPRLVRLSDDPSAVPLVLRALAHRPAWRYRYLALLADDARNLDDAQRIFSGSAEVTPLSRNEIDSWGNLRRRIDSHAGGTASVGSRAAGSGTDWYELADWGPVDRNAYAFSEDAYDSMGMP